MAKSKSMRSASRPGAVVTVSTLGRFSIEIAGSAVPLGKRARHKPLELLKSLIALGGEGVPTHQIADALWPDSDGYSAQRAFITNLHRLRELIGSEALHLEHGRLSVSSQACQVDALLLPELWRQAGDALTAGREKEGWELAQQALQLYAGPFLDGDTEPPGVLSARDRLHALHLRHIERMARGWSERQRYDYAAMLYERGLELDEGAEHLYQRLMECLQRGGHSAEALAVYQRCLEVVSARLGRGPAPETERLHAQLAAQHLPEQSAPQPAPAPATPRVAETRPAGVVESEHSGKPSIAILAFENMSGDPEQEFFGDGLVEDIITSLSAISSMTVIARNSTFTYKGKAVNVRQVAKDLGVRYVVEGSVRRSGSRLRITAQLIDSIDGSHIWAEKYDRIVDDIFDIQDEITKDIVTALQVELSNSEYALLLSRGTNNVQAWNHCVQAMEHWHKWNPADHAKARELFEQATIFDPDYALAWAHLSQLYWFGASRAFDEDAASGMARAAELAAKALALDETNLYALAANLLVQLHLGDHDQSLAIGKRLILLYPGSADSRAWYAFALLPSGHPQECISMMRDAIQINPRHPLWYENLLARALDVAGKPEESLDVLEGILAQQPNFFPVVLLRTGILAREGREKEAMEAVTDLRRINPNFRLAHVEGYFMYRDQEYVTAFTEALRKAGLPE